MVFQFLASSTAFPIPETIDGSFTSPNVTKALTYVSEGWIPVLPRVHGLIRERLASGYYRENRDLLVQDLQTDCGLFLRCIQKLIERAHAQADIFDEAWNPASMLHETPLEEIAQIIQQPVTFFSNHDLRSANGGQATRIGTTMVSATTSAQLAQHSGISYDLGFAVGLLRQLGMTLIAWNYPRVYERAVNDKTSTEPLDQRLSKVLGFSPKMLGLRLAHSWNLAPEIRLAMGDSAVTTALNDQERELAKNLAAICQASEALAAFATSNENHEKKNSWAMSCETIKRTLGSKGMAQLNAEIKRQLSAYVEGFPEQFNFTQQSLSNLENIPDSAPRMDRPTLASSSNRYLAGCSREVREELETLYRCLRADSITRESLELLLKHIIPNAGFVRGCVYFLDPELLVLKPSLVIGKVSLNAVSPVSYSHNAIAQEPLLQAFQGTTPIELEHSALDSNNVKGLAGSLGKSARLGLLYLECNSALAQQNNADTHMLFKALRQALNDCLKFH